MEKEKEINQRMKLLDLLLTPFPSILLLKEPKKLEPIRMEMKEKAIEVEPKKVSEINSIEV